MSAQRSIYATSNPNMTRSAPFWSWNVR